MLATALAACSASSHSDKIIQLPSAGNTAETVNGVAVPETLLRAVAKSGGLDLSNPQQRQHALDEVAQYVLLAQQARKQHLAQQPDLAATVEAARLRGVASATLQAYARSHPVGDSMVAADYAQKIQSVGSKRYRFSQLLFADQATADKAAAELKAGTPFSKVFDQFRSKAKEAHAYPAVFPAQLPAPLAAAIVKLKTGQATTTPIKSKLGWHLLHVEGIDTFHPPGLDKVKDQIRSALEKKRVVAYLDSLKKDAKITVVGPAQALSASAGPPKLKMARGKMVKQKAAAASVTHAGAPPATSASSR